MSFSIEPRRINPGAASLVCGAWALGACASLFSKQPATTSEPPASRTETRLEVTKEPYVEMPEPEPTPEPAPTASAPPEPGIGKTLTPTRGTLPKSAINEGIARGTDAFRSCYEAALKAKPGLRGKNINVNFVIAPDGTVPNADALQEGTDLTEPDVVECVLSAFEKLTFPEPSGGRVVVTYPVHFDPPQTSPAGSTPSK